MKTFRKSFWKSVSAPPLIIGTCGLLFIFIVFWLRRSGWNEIIICLFFIFMGAYMWILYMLVKHFFYLTMDDTGCCFQNGLRKSWKHDFRYEDIYCIKMAYAGGYSSPNIDVFLKGKRGFRRFIIDLVPESDYIPIINTFREKGVYVQTINMDRIFKRTKLPL